MIKILIADDQALLRGGLRAMLEAEPDMQVVAEAGDGAAAVDEAIRHHPDVILMDVRMPQLDGIEATRRILASGSRARILVITTFDLDEYAFEALRAGASGFLLKATPPGTLVSAVRAVSGGESQLDPQVTRRLIERFMHRPEPDAATQARLEELTERELEVLHLLVRGLTNEEMGERLFLSPATVKSHVTRILGKLGVRGRVQAVILAYESGLVQPGVPDA